MNAQELRIGNLVNWTEHYYGDSIVDHITEKEMFTAIKEIRNYGNVIVEGLSGLMDIKYIRPIPLTDEWLVKFGFNKGDDLISGKVFKLKTDGGLIIFQDDFCYIYSGLGDTDSYGYYIDVKHIHQLQNLYFALVGNELEIK